MPLQGPYAPIGMPPPAVPYTSDYSGGGGWATPGQGAQIAARSVGGDFVLNLVFVGVLWEVWILLYPLSAAIASFSLLYGAGLARRFVPNDSAINPDLLASSIAVAAALIVLWNVSRLEHVLARFMVYRIARHLVRVVLAGVIAIAAIQSLQGIPLWYRLPTRDVSQVLASPKNMGIVLGVMLAAHFVLWNWRWGRQFWHRRLMGAQLRKRGT